MKAKCAILFFVLVAFAAASLFPPWCYIENPSGHVRSFPVGIHFLLLPPDPVRDNYSPSLGVQIDFGRLVLEWLVIATSAGAAVLSLNLGKAKAA